jgi:Na+-driven multidrug efflux pump
LLTAFSTRMLALKLLRESQATADAIHGRKGPPALRTLTEMFTGFSLWNHLSGSIWTWVQSMDLFFLGILGQPPLLLGLYSVGVKIANFSLAIPMATGNLFGVWVGRRSAEEGIRTEKRLLAYSSGLILVGCIVQALALYAIAPFAIRFFSHGRWSASDCARILEWLKWILSGSALFGAAFLMNWWLTLRAKASQLFWRVSVPFLLLALGVYGGAAWFWGADGAAFANWIVGLGYTILLGIAFRGAA